MARSIMHRLKGATTWDRATGTPPFSVAGYAGGDVIEVDDGNGVIEELTVTTTAPAGFVAQKSAYLDPAGASTVIPIDDMGVQAGDLVVATQAAGDNTRRVAVLTGTGWVEIGSGGTANELFSNGTHDTTMKTWAKIMPTTPDTTVTLSGPAGSTGANAAHIRVYRGTGPAENIVFTGATFGAAQIDPPSFAGIPAGSIVVAIGAVAHNATTDPVLASPDLGNFDGLSVSLLTRTQTVAVYGGDIAEDGTGTMDLAAWSGAPALAGNTGVVRLMAIPLA